MAGLGQRVEGTTAHPMPLAIRTGVTREGVPPQFVNSRPRPPRWLDSLISTPDFTSLMKSSLQWLRRISMFPSLYTDPSLAFFLAIIPSVRLVRVICSPKPHRNPVHENSCLKCNSYRMKIYEKFI